MTDEMRETAGEIADDWQIAMCGGDATLLDERLRKEVIRLSKVWKIRRMCSQWGMSPDTVIKLVQDCELSE